MMTIKIGKFDIAQSAGAAGECRNSVTYAREHTGREPHSKKIRVVAADTQAVAEFRVAGRQRFMNIDNTEVEVAWNCAQAVMSVTTNSERFSVSADGKPVVLLPGASYTVDGAVGIFTDGLGVTEQHTAVVLFALSPNTTVLTQSTMVEVSYFNGTGFTPFDYYTINQLSADNGAIVTSQPSRLSMFDAGGASVTMSITSNNAYTIGVQPQDSSWFRVSKTEGTAGVTQLTVTVDRQEVNAAQRFGSVEFKSAVTGSVLYSLAVSQDVGDAYDVYVDPPGIAFLATDANVIKRLEVSTNAPWTIEEIN